MMEPEAINGLLAAAAANPVELQPADQSKVRRNHSINFYLHFKDVNPQAKREIDKIVLNIIQTINMHPRRTSEFDEVFQIFNLRDTDEYVTYLQCPAEGAKGFIRNYFDGKNAFGKTCFNGMALQIKEYRCGPLAKSLFDARVVQQNWIPYNSISKAYYEQYYKQIESSFSMIKDLTDSDFKEKGTLKEIKHDFSMRYFKGQVDSTQKYYQLLQESGAHRLFFEALDRSDDFDKMTEHLDDFLQAVAEHPDIKADLDKHCSSMGDAAPKLDDVVKRI